MEDCTLNVVFFFFTHPWTSSSGTDSGVLLVLCVWVSILTVCVAYGRARALFHPHISSHRLPLSVCSSLRLTVAALFATSESGTLRPTILNLLGSLRANSHGRQLVPVTTTFRTANRRLSRGVSSSSQATTVSRVNWLYGFFKPQSSSWTFLVTM